jgi:hypothetical protein
MKLELNFYKSTGKWYAKEVITVSNIEDVSYNVEVLYPGMDYTVHIVESDGYLQPYRMFKRSIV